MSQNHTTRTEGENPAGEPAEIRSSRPGQRPGVSPALVAALRDLWASGDSQGFAQLLVSSNRAAEVLADPLFLDRKDAIRAARTVAASVPQLDVKLMNLLPSTVITLWDAEEVQAARRILGVVAEISDGMRIRPALNRVLRSPIASMRSKAILLLIRSTRNPGLAKKQQMEANDRVRANAVEGLWNHRCREAIEFLRVMAQDPHHRVRANAIVGLHLLGEPEAPTLLSEMLSHESTAFRRAAVWALGYIGGPDCVERLNSLRRDANQEIRRGAVRALAYLRQRGEATTDGPSAVAGREGAQTETS